MKTILLYKDGTFICIDRNSLFEYWDDSVEAEYPMDYCKNLVNTNLAIIEKLKNQNVEFEKYIKELEDPDDAYRRILCHHAESGSIFEAFSLSEFAQYCND